MKNFPSKQRDNRENKKNKQRKQNSSYIKTLRL